ncbi:MAG TPA: hypothetical protein VIV11_30350 [Kofleriaceae bacterium]
MSEAAATSASVPTLDAKTLLARINARISLLRGWLSHDHHDEPYWWARKASVPTTQRERNELRWYANLIHVERATSRGRIHGTQFANLDEQRAWLAKHEAAGLPCDSTLVILRASKLSL